MEKNYEILDYSDRSSKNSWFRKLDVLGKLWTVYGERSNPNEFDVPVEYLMIEGRSVDAVDGILDGFKKEDCFDWSRKSKTYKISNIKHYIFAKTYDRIKLEYNTFSKVAEEKAAKESVKKSAHDSGKNKRFIDYHDSDFYCKNKLIDFPEREAIYVKLVEVLYTKSDHNGHCSYDTINRFFESKHENKITDREKQTKRIHNAIQGLHRRRASQSVHFPQKAPDGRLIIDVNGSKGLVFYNPE